MHRALIAAAIAAVIGAPAAPTSAWADTGGSAWNNGSSIGAGASAGAPGGSGTSGSGGASSCSYEPLSPQDQSDAADLYANGMGPGGSGPGTWYREICAGPNGTTSATIVWAPTAPVVNVNALAQQAASATALPSPAVRRNPAGEQVTQVQTWLWIDPGQWRPVSATATAGNVTVTATATPESVTFTMGDGGPPVTCDGPGTPYDPSRPASSQSTDCSYTYATSSNQAPGGAFMVTATVSYHVTWVAAGAPGGGDLGVATRSFTEPVRVAQIQALNQPTGQGE